MKKRILLAFTVLFTVFSFAQNLTKRELKDFHSIKVYDLIDVELIKSDTNMVEVSNSDFQNLQFLNKEGLLKIKMVLTKSFGGKNVKVKLHYKSLELIDLNEGSSITSKSPVESFELKVNAQEKSKVDLTLDTKILDIKCHSGSIINLLGKCRRLNASVSTGGVFNGDKIETQDADLFIKTGGVIRSSATNKVKIKVVAGGDVFLYNKPKEVEESLSLGGSVTYVKI